MDVTVLSGIGIGGPRGGLPAVYGDQSVQCGTQGHSAAAPPLSRLYLVSHTTLPFPQGDHLNQCTALAHIFLLL